MFGQSLWLPIARSTATSTIAESSQTVDLRTWSRSSIRGGWLHAGPQIVEGDAVEEEGRRLRHLAVPDLEIPGIAILIGTSRRAPFPRVEEYVDRVAFGADVADRWTQG
jgi:hypothetical protein